MAESKLLEGIAKSEVSKILININSARKSEPDSC